MQALIWDVGVLRLSLLLGVGVGEGNPPGRGNVTCDVRGPCTHSQNIRFKNQGLDCGFNAGFGVLLHGRLD